MDTKDLLKKVRKIEIKTRRLSDNLFGGEYHSTFKGRGMTFSEVRQYQFGDDVRNIDWNVTARYNEPFVKVFEEERELTMMLLVDVSGSSIFGTEEQFKDEIVTEIAATLAFSAMQNNDKIGVIFFSDEIELYIPPNVMKKKAIVFVLSDFIGDNYKDTLKIAAKRHDITGFRVYDKAEENMPNLGMVQMEDAETGELLLVNTASKSVRNNYYAYHREREDYFTESFSKSGAGVISCRVDESYVKKLLGYFKKR